MISEQLLLAQQAADDTGRTIRLIIMGLLAVALLLTVLTVWYWRHTDPRRRIRDPLGELGRDELDHDELDREFGRDERGAGQYEGVPSRPEPRLQADDGADEWLRLTGPDALRRGQEQTH